MKHLHTTALGYRALMMGFLTVFLAGIVIEFIETPLLALWAVVLVVCGLVLARYAAHHFHGDHTHVGDSAIDIVALGALIIANVLHPMVDGFSWYETISRNVTAGILYGISIIGHEYLRQWALIEVTREHMKRATITIISTALLGIVIGVGLGLLGTNITEGHEHIADLATVFAYSFIIGEFFFAGHGHGGKRSTWLIVLGLLIGAFFTFFLKGH